MIRMHVKVCTSVWVRLRTRTYMHVCLRGEEAVTAQAGGGNCAAHSAGLGWRLGWLSLNYGGVSGYRCLPCIRFEAGV